MTDLDLSRARIGSGTMASALISDRKRAFDHFI